MVAKAKPPQNPTKRPHHRKRCLLPSNIEPPAKPAVNRRFKALPAGRLNLAQRPHSVTLNPCGPARIFASSGVVCPLLANAAGGFCRGEVVLAPVNHIRRRRVSTFDTLFIGHLFSVVVSGFFSRHNHPKMVVNGFSTHNHTGDGQIIRV